ncbi:viperin family antiviral radical SAM protein [Winogradskyella sp.]
MKTQLFIPSVNFHLWEPCNMRCKFCFATFQDVKQTILPKGHLPKEEALKVVREIAKAGFKKITFAGGEPTLCPWLPELIREAKDQGLTTMIVSNGSRLTDQFLEQNKSHLDWIAISIDSLNSSTNLKIGRAITGKKALTKTCYFNLIKKIEDNGYGLKINTVVNTYNYQEDFNVFINQVNPKRWKVLQVLPIEGQNDVKVDEFTISETQFSEFISRHKDIQCIVPEYNSDITNSYVMIDPAGRFFSNEKGKHEYSKPILDIGIKQAFKSRNYDYTKFISRDGLYNWTN